MTSFLIILILLLCVVLSFFVLIQKPKGSGLSGSFGSLGAQVMGVKKSSDTMEKGTWYTIAIIGALCIATVFTIDRVNTKAPAQQEQAPAQQQQGQGQ